MEIKKALIKGKFYDVVSQNEYERRASLGEPAILEDTLIERNNTLYPVVKGTDHRSITTPYAIFSQLCVRYVGNSKQFPDYSSSKVVNFSDVKTSKELIEKQNRLREDETVMLAASSSSKCFAPIVRDEDSPFLAAYKEALTAKKIDIENYRGRFKSNCDFSNMVRLFVNPNNHNLSVGKAMEANKYFDLKTTFTISDEKSSPNPMGKSITGEL